MEILWNTNNNRDVILLLGSEIYLFWLIDQPFLQIYKQGLFYPKSKFQEVTEKYMNVLQKEYRDIIVSFKKNLKIDQSNPVSQYIPDIRIKFFALGLHLLKRFALSFYFCTYDRDNTFQRHSASWYPAISSSVFSILFDSAILHHHIKSKLFSTSMFSEVYYTFCFKNLSHLHSKYLIG